MLYMKEYYIYLLVVSAFISISLFEVFVVIGLLILIFDVIRKKIKIEGVLSKPLITFGSISVVSTLMFAPKMIAKSIEEGIFQFLYFFKSPKKIEDTIKNLIWLFTIIGLLLIPVLIFKYVTTSYPTPIWGSTFETGQFYAMFSIMAIALGLYHLHLNKDKKNFFIFLLLSLVFLSILFWTHRRSPLMGYFIVSYLMLFVLYRNNILKKVYFFSVSIAVLIFAIGGYFYLSVTDIRFKTFNQILIGEKTINYTTLNRISSSRYKIGIDAVNIIKNDIKEGNWINLLIGHGIRSGYYLPHKYSPDRFTKYESIFILSEFIEKGLIGLLAILAIFYYAFKTFLSVRISESFDLLALGLFVPLLIHLIGSIFTFFWDALLPLYLLLFKIGEIYFVQKKNVLIQ